MPLDPIRKSTKRYLIIFVETKTDSVNFVLRFFISKIPCTMSVVETSCMVYLEVFRFCSPNNEEYRIAGKLGGRKFGKFGKSSVIRQTKTIQINTYN